MKYTTTLLALILLVTSCEQNSKVQEPLTYIPIEFDCSSTDSLNTNSKLVELSETLAELKNNYEIKSSGKGDTSTSILINGLNRMQKTIVKNELLPRVINYDKFIKSIDNINHCKVKGTKDLGGRLFARANIEEIIFKSKNCAEEAYILFDEIYKSTYPWEYIDKSPNSIFTIDNRLYYVSAGGYFMADFFGEIENKMRSKSP